MSLSTFRTMFAQLSLAEARAAPAERASAPDLEAEAQRQKTTLLYRNAGIAFVVNSINASLVAYVNAKLESALMLAVAWWCVVMAIAAGRYILALRFHMARPDAAAATIWRKRYIAGTVLIAAAWSAGTALFMWKASDGALLFTGLALCGMVAGAVPMLAPVRTAFVAFALLIAIPMSSVIFLQAGSALDWAFGTMSVVFLPAVLASARYLHDTLDASIHLGLEKSRLVEKLESARYTAEAAVEASGLSLWDFDPAAGRIRLDENWAKIVGGAPGARRLSAAELLRSVDAAGRARVTRAANAVIKGVAPSLVEEIRIVTADRGVRWVLCRGKVVSRSANGRALRAVGTCVDITERKAAEEALAASEQRFRKMFDRHNAVMLLVDAQTGRIRDANAAATRFYGYAHDQLCEKTVHDINGLPPEEVTANVANALAEKRNSFIVPHRLASGEMRSVEVHSTPIAVNGRTLLFSIIHDITEREHFQRKLLTQSARNELFLQRASDGIHIVDGSGDVIEASDSLCAMLGYDKAEILKLRIADLELPANEGLSASVRELIAVGGATTFETQYRHRSGSLVDVEVSTAAIELDGEPLLHVSARDITEKKHQLAAIEQAASVFAHAHDGIMICDARERIVDVNPAFTRITGYAKEDVLARRPGFLSSGRYDAAFYRAMREKLHEHDFWEGEIWNRRNGGELYLERLYIAVIRDANGAVLRYIGMFSDITQLRLQHEQLKMLAHHDALTGLPNRVLLADRMGQAIANSKRSGKSMAVCYLDLDGFKAINDAFGHEAGDSLLVEMARRLQQAVRGHDTVARLGGDEFALLLAGFDSLEHAEHAIARLMSAITPPLILLDRVVSMTASVGVTLFPDDCGDPDTLLRHADQAMYLAKQSGKSCFRLFNPEHDRVARAHREALERVRSGIRDGELVLHYQPKVNMRDGALVGFEALVRWQHPLLGRRLPADFLPIIAGTDGELELGNWVLDGALDQLAAWRKAGHDFELSVNVSATHLLHPGFVDSLRRRLEARPAVAPSRLEIEILETAALEDIERATTVIRQCHSLGLRVALDDFGTGHSSLSYVRLLPVDTVKIDRLFIRNVPRDPENVAVIQCILGLTRAFGRRVIAEGVETAIEGRALIGMGCDIGQGFGIGDPMPASAVEGWQRQWQRSPLRWSAPPVQLVREEPPALVAAGD